MLVNTLATITTADLRDYVKSDDPAAWRSNHTLANYIKDRHLCNWDDNMARFRVKDDHFTTHQLKTIAKLINSMINTNLLIEFDGLWGTTLIVTTTATSATVYFVNSEVDSDESSPFISNKVDDNKLPFPAFIDVVMALLSGKPSPVDAICSERGVETVTLRWE